MVHCTKYVVRKLVFIWKTRGVQATGRSIYREVLRFVLSKVFKRRIIRTKIFNFQLLLDMEDRGISRTLWLFGERELDHKWIIEKTLAPGAKVLDIGANIGYYVLIESKLIGDVGQIVAVEPSPSNLNMFNQNVQLNGLKQVTIVEGAVSNVAGVEKFWLAEESNLNTFRKDILEQRGSLRQGIDVNVFTVQDLVQKYGSFDYLRMDVEGHEVQVLQDIVLMGLKGNKCPNIIFEPHINTYKKSNKNQDIGMVLRDLEKIGYEVGFVASSSVRGTRILEDFGYPSINRIRTDEVFRTIHKDIQTDQLIDCLERTGGIRTVFLRFNQ